MGAYFALVGALFLGGAFIFFSFNAVLIYPKYLSTKGKQIGRFLFICGSFLLLVAYFFIIPLLPLSEREMQSFFATLNRYQPQEISSCMTKNGLRGEPETSSDAKNVIDCLSFLDSEKGLAKFRELKLTNRTQH